MIRTACDDVVDCDRIMIMIQEVWEEINSKRSDKEINSNTGKKSRFFKVFKLPGTKCITTVSKENFEKKVTTTIVDFNNKVLNK